MANSGNRRCGECFVFSTSVLAFGSGTNIVGSERSRGTVLTNGWRKSRKTFLVCLSIGIMVFFRSVFFMKSRMNREVHVRFWERFGGETPPYLLDLILKLSRCKRILSSSTQSRRQIEQDCKPLTANFGVLIAFVCVVCGMWFTVTDWLF